MRAVRIVPSSDGWVRVDVVLAAEGGITMAGILRTGSARRS
jgi:hypothetical protein